jgi:hypothetical protein
MSRKQIASLIAFVLGLGMIAYAIHGMHEAAEAKGFVDDVTNFFSHNTMWNPLIEFFGGEAQGEVSKYDVPLLLLFIGGIVLAIAGGAGFIVCRRKSL